jgi:glucosylceramidase
LVTIDSRTGEVTRNDDYYALAHVSRFVLQGADRIDSTPTGPELVNVAFRNPRDGSIVLVAANSSSDPMPLSVLCQGSTFKYTMAPQSVATFVWAGTQATR